MNQVEILQLLSNDKSEAFAKLLQESLNGILKAESTAQLQAEPYERTSERKSSRNGFRDRPYVTRIGTITLKVPKHRDGETFRTLLFDNYTRSEAALIATMVEIVVNQLNFKHIFQNVCAKLKYILQKKKEQKASIKNRKINLVAIILFLQPSVLSHLIRK